MENVHHCRGEVLAGFAVRAVACLPVVVTGGAPTISVRCGETQNLSSDLAHMHLTGGSKASCSILCENNLSAMRALVQLGQGTGWRWRVLGEIARQE